MKGSEPAGRPRGLSVRLPLLLQQAWRSNAAWLSLLVPLSLLYRSVLLVRGAFYRWSLRPIYRAPVPLVVVGNISVGGTGKTPVVSALARALRERGLRVGVVSRGYGAAPGPFPRRVTADSDWSDSGDEPLMIARQTACPVVIAPLRVAAVKELLRWQPVDIVIADDGLQHLAMARDMEIVLLDPTIGLGNGRLLPAGPLREPPARLSQCDVILQRDAADAARRFSYRCQEFVNIQSGEKVPANAFAGRSVLAMAGIANPENFFATLSHLGLDVFGRAYRDHHPFTADDFSDARGRPIIMTEKDAVKCEAFAGPEVWFLRISAELPADLVEQVAGLAAPAYH